MAIEAAKLFIRAKWDDSEVDKGIRDVNGRLRDARGRYMAEADSSGGLFSSLFGSSALSSAGTLALAGVTAAASGAALGVGAVTKSFMSVEDALTPLGTAVGRNSEQFEALSKATKDVIAGSPKNAGELGAAIYDILGAGITDTERAVTTLKDSQKLALAGMSDVGSASDVLTSAMNSFQSEGLSSTKAAEIFFGTLQVGKGTLGDFAQGFGAIAPLASTAGVKFQELMAATAALTTTGMPASQAYTQLRATISQFLKPSSEASKLAKALGFDMSATALKSKGLAGVMDEMKVATGGNVSQMATLLGSTEALNAVLALTGDQAGTFKSALEGVAESGKSLDERAREVTDTLSNKFAIAKNRTMVFLADLGEKGFDALGPKIEKAGSAVMSFLKGDTAGAGVDIGTMLGFDEDSKETDNIIKALERLRNAFVTIGDWVVQYGPTVIGWFVTIGGHVVTVFATAINVVSSVVEWFGKFRDKLSETSESTAGFRENFNEVWTSVRETFSSAVETITLIGERLVSFFSGIWDIAGPTLIEKFKNIWTIVSETVSAVWEPMAAAIQGGLAMIQGIFDVFNNLIKGDWGALWDSITSIFDGWNQVMQNLGNVFWEVFKGIFRVGVEAVQAVWAVFTATIQESVGALWGWVKRETSEAMGGLWSAVSRGVGDVIGVFGNLTSNVTSAAWEAWQNVLNVTFNGWNSIWNAVSNGISSVTGIVRSLPGNMISALWSLSYDFYNAGWDAIQGLINGLWGRAGDAFDAAWNIASTITKTIKNAWNVFSPSKEFMKLGDFAMQGLEIGLRDGVKGVEATLRPILDVESLVHPVGAPAFTAPASTASNGANIVNHNTLNITTQPGQTADEIVRKVKEWMRVNGSLPIRVGTV